MFFVVFRRYLFLSSKFLSIFYSIRHKISLDTPVIFKICLLYWWRRWRPRSKQGSKLAKVSCSSFHQVLCQFGFTCNDSNINNSSSNNNTILSLTCENNLQQHKQHCCNFCWFFLGSILILFFFFWFLWPQKNCWCLLQSCIIEVCMYCCFHYSHSHHQHCYPHSSWATNGILPFELPFLLQYLPPYSSQSHIK